MSNTYSVWSSSSSNFPVAAGNHLFLTALPPNQPWGGALEHELSSTPGWLKAGGQGVCLRKQTFAVGWIKWRLTLGQSWRYKILIWDQCLWKEGGVAKFGWQEKSDCDVGPTKPRPQPQIPSLRVVWYCPNYLGLDSHLVWAPDLGSTRGPEFQQGRCLQLMGSWRSWKLSLFFLIGQEEVFLWMPTTAFCNEESHIPISGTPSQKCL